MRHKKSLGWTILCIGEGGVLRIFSRGNGKRDDIAPPEGAVVTVTAGDIIIRYKRVYEAANHVAVHIFEQAASRYSV